MTVFKIHIHFILYRHLIILVNPTMYKWGRSRNWMHQKSLSLVHRKNIKKKLQMTALWPRYPRGWGWCKNFQDKRPTRISAGLCELDAVGDEDGNRWMVGEFLCISFLFSFNSFNSFMYNNPEVDKIVTWFLEVSYSIYSRITLSLYIYIYLHNILVCHWRYPVGYL